MNYHKIDSVSIANGSGVRVVLWVSGCSLHCKGCHNPETWSFKSGKPFDNKTKRELFKKLKKPYIKGITLSGGHPLEQKNLRDVFYLIEEINRLFPDKDIWLYTGLTLNDDDFKLTRNTNIMQFLLWSCDVIVDGAYIESLRDTTLPFRGSSNQRLIDVKRTLEQGEIVLLNLEKE